MRSFSIFLVCLVIGAASQVKAQNEILNILNTANDLTLQEVNALCPIFDELQKQYDAIKAGLDSEGSDDIVPWQKEAIAEPAIEDYVNLLEKLLMKPIFENLTSHKYDTKLPRIAELMADVPLQTIDMTAEQTAELQDMQQIMQEVLDEAQFSLDELVKRALSIEAEILKLNKPKMWIYIYKALWTVFRYSAQLSRAAYCVYSHVPQLNESLQHLNDGVDCYAYTRSLVHTVEREVIRTAAVIKKNVNDLAKVYKKIAAKNSIVGKIVTAVLNVSRIMQDIRETLAAATKAIDGLENQLPSAAVKSVDCGLNFTERLPFMLETTLNITTCVTYIDTETEKYEFLLPESERNFK